MHACSALCSSTGLLNHQDDSAELEMVEPIAPDKTESCTGTGDRNPVRGADSVELDHSQVMFPAVWPPDAAVSAAVQPLEGLFLQVLQPAAAAAAAAVVVVAAAAVASQQLPPHYA